MNRKKTPLDTNIRFLIYFKRDFINFIVLKILKRLKILYIFCFESIRIYFKIISEIYLFLFLKSNIFLFLMSLLFLF
jgi:hypothetical protein